MRSFSDSGCRPRIFATLVLLTAGIGNALTDSIQDAIDDAADGDTVWVDPGTYAESITFKGKGIVVSGREPTDPEVVSATVIDASDLQRSVVRFSAGEGSGSVLRGLTITGGAGTPHAWGELGVPSTAGGGILCRGSAPRIEYCVIRDNVVSGTESYGGGALCIDGAAPVFRACAVRSNSGVRGSAFYLSGRGTHVTFEDGVIADECSRNRNANIAYIVDGAVLEISDTILERNPCLGGLIANRGTIRADRCIVREGCPSFFLLFSSFEEPASVARNCLIHDNERSRSVFFVDYSRLRIENCTVVRNDAYSYYAPVDVHGGEVEISHYIF